LVCSPTLLRFGIVPVGQSETQLIALTNTGQTGVTISSISVGSSEFSVTGLKLPAVLAAGQSVNLSVTFAPTTLGGTGVNLTIGSNASNPNFQIPLQGTGVNSDPLTATPSSLSFGQVALGSSSTLLVVLTNARSWNETLNAFRMVGNDFSVSGPTLPVTLSPGQSVTVNIVFTPKVAGLTSGSVTIFGPVLNIPLTGTGGTTIGQLTVAPASLNFGSVTVGSTGTQTTTVSATGGSVTISSVASSSSQFALSGVSLPLTLSAGQSAQLSVAYTPQNTGSTSATLSFASNATNSTASESLSGTGAPPYVTLSWNPSTSTVAGYNVYRRISTGSSYTKINSSLDPNTSYTDTTVAVGQTYDYATTAVDSSGVESTYSNQVQIVIP